MPEKCDASHDGHDCSVPGACTKALSALLARVEARKQAEEAERERLLASGTETRAVRPN